MSDGFEWLDWLEPSGPFLAPPVLKSAFPQGLSTLDPSKRKALRQAYDEYREALESEDPESDKFHAAWIDLVLRQGLDYDEDESGDNLKSAADLPDGLAIQVAEHGVTLKPDFAFVGDQCADKPMMLIQVYKPDVNLNDPVRGDGWASSPRERMVRLCRDTETRLGLVTNGEHWLFVDAPVGAVSSFANWYARLWGPEPVLLQAFVVLLGIRRFFLAVDEQLPALINKSVEYQDEVTEALGEQVRRAVEVLIQALDKADVDRNRELLKDVDPRQLYEAGLTVMMRLVFLLSAEERELLLLGDERYEANYAVSTLRMQLRGEDDAILQRRWDAWSRLLAIFRAIYCGIEHETLRMPALGGSLFDPDRFPFLEGRDKDSSWKTDPAKPLPIDNQTVLLILDAIQLFEGRTLSYRGLDIEQLGYVYEGLLDHTVKRAKEVTIELDATKSAKQPWVTLGELESAKLDGEKAVEKLLKERTGSSISRVRNDLKKEIKPQQSMSLLTACHNDQAVRDQLNRYFHLIRTDSWGRPLVYPEGSFMVTTGEDRRQTGSHYTPTSLTEAIVGETLEPVVYIGPVEGKPREEWQLKSPEELLDLKVCDPAMGSGAFLVQVCRWLGERVVESWRLAEKQGSSITSEGEVVEEIESQEPLTKDAEERLITARRLIAERCIYGVDINPLAVELAKLSVWLVTLAKGRPFGFLDHCLRSGNSLLGLDKVQQLVRLDLNSIGKSQIGLFENEIVSAVASAIELRLRIRSTPIRNISDISMMAELAEQASEMLQIVHLVADALLAAYISSASQRELNTDLALLNVAAQGAFNGEPKSIEQLENAVREQLTSRLGEANRPFHWPIEFPEVFQRGRKGFDAVVGNPPYINAVDFYSSEGGDELKVFYKKRYLAAIGSYDIFVLFLERANAVSGDKSAVGLLIPNKFLSADYALKLRQLICSSSRIATIIDYSRFRVFAASVYPIILITVRPFDDVPALIGKGGALDTRQVPQVSFSSAPGLLWSYLLTDYAELVVEAFADTVPLGKYLDASGAATVAEAYEIKNFVRSSDGTSVPHGHKKFVVSGNIRANSTTWECAPVQYLKTSYSCPIVNVSGLPVNRRAQADTPKIIMSGLARRPIAYFDIDAEYLSGKSTVILLNPSSEISLDVITSILNSKFAALIYNALYGGLALGGGYMRFGPPQMAAFPVPSASMMRNHRQLSDSEVCDLYGVKQDKVNEAFDRNFNVD